MATEIVIPMLGVTVEKGKIAEWLKNEGDTIEKGESIFVVEADKVTTEVESPASGILAKILLSAGDEVPVLTVVGVITEPGEAVPDHYLSVPGATMNESADSPKSVTSVLKTDNAGAPRPETDGPVKIVPAARKLAQDNNLDIQSVIPTGPEGIITYRDIVHTDTTVSTEGNIKVSTLARRQAAAAGISLDSIEGTGVRGRIMRADLDGAGSTTASMPTNAQELSAADMDSEFGKIVPMDGMRETIARRLSSSAFTAPHVAFYTDIYMDPLLTYRKGILAAFEEKYALRPSINDFLIKAVALTIREFPMLNGTLKGNEIHILPNINIGLAVAIPNGLIVPALTNSDQHGLSEITRQRSDLVPRALEGKLTMEEMERGSFTVSSLAQFDVTFFTSILNPPQSGILSVGKTREELALVDGEVIIKRVSTMGLTVDHRIIDGALAANFLQMFKKKMESPEFTFMHS